MKNKIFSAVGSGLLATMLLTVGAGAQAKNLADIAILKFYPAAQGTRFPWGSPPTALCSTVAASGWAMVRATRS